MEVAMSIIMIVILVVGCYLFVSGLAGLIEWNNETRELCLQLGFDKVIYTNDNAYCSRLADGTTQIIPIERTE